jgi:hypothetical protein
MSNVQSRRWPACCGLLLVGAFFGVNLPSAASGALLNLTQAYPDIDSTFIDFGFVHSTGQFSASGFPDTLNMVGLGANPGGPGRPFINNGQFSIDMVGNTANGFTPTSGHLEIDGSITGLSPGPVLLKGNLTQFGFTSAGSGEFDFIFKLTTDQTGKFGVGNSVGVVFHLGSSPAPDFSSDFSSNGSSSGVADTFLLSVPEPTSAQYLGILIACGTLSRLIIILCRKKGRLARAKGSAVSSFA